MGLSGLHNFIVRHASIKNSEKQREQKEHQYDYVPQETVPVEEKLKSQRFEPEKILT